MSAVLVTGSKGYIGANLSKFLGQCGYSVFGIDAEFLNDDDWTNTLIAKLDLVHPKIVFHVGACSDTLENNVQKIMIKNYEATKLITDWCIKNESKIIFSSSAANYGVSGKYPSNLYGWSKYVAEDYVRKSGGVALRYFNVYGPGEENKGKMASLLCQAYKNKLARKSVYLYPGKPMRDFVYISDVLDANLYALLNYSELAGEFYEVSTGQPRTFEEVMNLAGIEFNYLPESKVPNGYQFYTCGNVDKWMKNWQPKIFLEVGVQQYLAILDSSH